MPTTSDREDPTAEPGLGAVSSLGGLAAVVAENAVDDTEDLPDDDTVEVKKTNSYGRRRHSNHKYHKIHEKLDSSFHPNIRPLTISDLESCVVLENAAFTDPSHRCSREKVSHFSFLFFLFSYKLSCPTYLPAFLPRFDWRFNP